MKNLFILIAIAMVPTVAAQSNWPVIKATSSQVAINDGGYLDKNAWTLSPETRPDVYTSSRSRKPKWVTFYTNLDSIRVKVRPGDKFNFVILLNGKDSCFTQIESAVPAKPKPNSGEAKSDTIPFLLTGHNAIHVKAWVNEIDSLDLHFDLGSLQFRITKEALRKTKGWPLPKDAANGSKSPERMALDKIETIRMGNQVWKSPDVRLAQVAAHNMDGRFGWQVFDGKIFEIDYEKSRIIIHPSLPKKKRGYAKSEIKFIQSLFCIEASLIVRSKKYTGNFLVDTGSDLAMILDSGWAAKQHFPTDLPLLKKSSFKDGAGRQYETRIVSVPKLRIKNAAIDYIPTSVLGAKSPVGFDVNYFGNDLLKRFNMIIDLQTDHIYLKKNGLAGLPFKAV